ncbi:zinc finger protein 569-like [Diaphorina citri]|uniref:Zinc finger protein 569-like n=1 Tax=Diaphorina citri TaxID=121845 RepID=A0A1S3D4U5_DIACI|nr:zinc finger protein 569-like [Diaphorina citri]
MRYYESDLKDKVVPQKCPLCERLYKSVYRMKEHMKKQHKGQLYECDCCTEYFIDRIAYEEHVRLHEGGIICRLCGEKFEKSLMRDHLVTHIPPEHRGKVSDAFFNKKQTALLTHYLKRNGIKLQCNLCADTFCPRSNMLRHYLLKHRGDKVFYACDRCDKRFSLLQNLKRHLAIHERIAYQCNVCDKKYSRLSDYKIHMNMHNGFKYQCHICLKCTSRKNYLKRHIIMMHTKFEGQIGEMEDKVGEKKIGEIEAKK